MSLTHSTGCEELGTLFINIKRYILVILCFGFETNLRVGTSELEFLQIVFPYWRIVSGYSLHCSMKIIPLDASPENSLSYDFLLKTRHIKGLSQDVSMKKLFDKAI